MPTGQTISRLEVYTDQTTGAITQVVVSTKPNNHGVSARDVSNGNWPGLEDSCVAAFDTLEEGTWARLKALDPEPPPEPE